MNKTIAASPAGCIGLWALNSVPRSFPLLFGCWLFCLSNSLGCWGSGEHPTLGEVSGTITIDGRPLGEALISFHAVAGGRISTATSDANGHYELIYLVYPQLVKGARLGLNTVYVSTYQGNDGALRKMRPELVPYCYRKKDSILRVVVERGRNIIDLQLKSDCGMEPLEIPDSDFQGPAPL